MSASVTNVHYRVDFTARCPACGEDAEFVAVGEPVLTGLCPTTRLREVEVHCDCGEAA